MDNKTGSNHGHNVVRKCRKSRETLGTLSKHGLLFWHDIAIHGPKKVQNWQFFPNALFLRFPWDLPTILARGPNPNPKTPFFYPRSYSKGPNHALEKVLTNETPVSGMATVPFVYVRGRASNPWRKTLPDFGTRIRKHLVVEKGTIPPDKGTTANGPSSWQESQVDLSQSRQYFASTGVSTSPRLSEWFPQNGKSAQSLEIAYREQQ